jgi:hypothetical protein
MIVTNLHVSNVIDTYRDRLVGPKKLITVKIGTAGGKIPRGAARISLRVYEEVSMDRPVDLIWLGSNMFENVDFTVSRPRPHLR